MNILSQNGKMKKSSQNGIHIYNFGIPAFLSQSGIKTCPNAGQCATGCYARSGTYRFKNVANAYEERLKLTQSPNFVELMHNEIRNKMIRLSPNETCLIRIHDSGDFYSAPYWDKWNLIMRGLPNVKFYAYTKMIQFFKQSHIEIPPNFTLIYSFGGLQDSQIDTEKDRHSMVFQNETDLLAAGYINASADDLKALSPNPKVGLVYHGQKSYTNTGWGKVSK
jgi:hypothetical protein